MHVNTHILLFVTCLSVCIKQTSCSTADNHCQEMSALGFLALLEGCPGGVALFELDFKGLGSVGSQISPPATAEALEGHGCRGFWELLP